MSDTAFLLVCLVLVGAIAAQEVWAGRLTLASADTRPKGGDSTEIEAPFTSGAVPHEDAADAPIQP